MNHKWLDINIEDIKIEREQCLDEGKDLSLLEKDFNYIFEKEKNKMEFKKDAQKLLDSTISLPIKKDYLYEEPSSLKEIKEARPKGPRKIYKEVSDKRLYDKILGAWLGRCSGCLLGKPVEGWNTKKMWGYLKELKRYPLSDYFISDIPLKVINKYNIDIQNTFINKVEYMPEDDDTNYTVLGLILLKEHNNNFTSEDVADLWMSKFPILHTCTAERVAYKNFVQQIPPPISARFRNPYREWIGAQIRGDVFGYVSIGEPELAAELAFRDANISHVKNGIYGEMWVAAMLAAAGVKEDIEEIIEIGLSEIPKNSRFTEGILQVKKWYKKGLSYEEAITQIHKMWDEANSHQWCHVISNAQIVALGLLWSDFDFEKAICRSVQACFDTDCNGATVGSIMGMILGAKNLPQKWINPLNNTLQTGVAGYNEVKISDIAKDTFNLCQRISFL